MNYMNNNRILARKYFGILNNPDMVLHHKDITLKERDPDRYKEWRIEDLEVVTKEEHVRIHKPSLGYHHTNESKSKISNSLKGRKLSDSHKEELSKSKIQYYKDNPESLKKRSVDAKKNYSNTCYHIKCKSCNSEFLSDKLSRRYCDKCKSR